jgi:hypothetical protein
MALPPPSMRRQLRRHLVAVACLAAALLVGLAAIADHHLKNERSDRAELAEWYCTHLGTRCGGESSAGIEDGWNDRELGYEIAVGVLGLGGGGLLLLRSRRAALERRRRARTPG